MQARKEGRGSQECRCRVSGQHSPGGNADVFTRGPCGDTDTAQGLACMQAAWRGRGALEGIAQGTLET